MKKIYTILNYWIPPLIWMSTIFYLSSRQRVVVSEEYTINFVIFKSLHIIEYAMLTFLLFRALYQVWYKRLTRVIIYTFIISLLYAVSDELHQTFVPTREGKMRDIGIDLIGIILAIQYTRSHIRTLTQWL